MSAHNITDTINRMCERLTAHHNAQIYGSALTAVKRVLDERRLPSSNVSVAYSIGVGNECANYEFRGFPAIDDQVKNAISSAVASAHLHMCHTDKYPCVALWTVSKTSYIPDMAILQISKKIRVAYNRKQQLKIGAITLAIALLFFCLYLLLTAIHQEFHGVRLGWLPFTI
jgi:hypothetical protein